MNGNSFFYRGIRRFFVSLFFCAILLCAASCGIAVYTSLEPTSSRRLASPTDPGGRYFSFYTNDTGNSYYWFKGTNVFYKIYNNQNELTSEYTSINAANTEYSSNGYNRMTALGYQQLNATNNILFAPGTNREVSIRLFDEGWNSAATPPAYDFPAGIFENNALRMRPLRRSNMQGFNFYVDPDPVPVSDPNDYDDLPVSGDTDTRFSSSPEANTWYVAAYAVSVGQDEYLTPLYSQLLWLGYIQIKQ